MVKSKNSKSKKLNKRVLIVGGIIIALVILSVVFFILLSNKDKSVDDIIPYENNPRHNDNAVEYVANSIKEFGFKVPIIIDKENVIVTGHTRLKAAEKLGLKEVPCIMAEDLSEEQIKAFRIADNKVSEYSTWDLGKLDLELADLDIDMSQFGILENDEEEISDLEEKEKPEIEFTEVLGEEHNYIVLYFDNDVDWLQAESLFDIKPKMNLSTRIDENISSSMERVSVGRVINGAKALESLRKHYENIS